MLQALYEGNPPVTSGFPSQTLLLRNPRLVWEHAFKTLPQYAGGSFYMTVFTLLAARVTCQDKLSLVISQLSC